MIGHKQVRVRVDFLQAFRAQLGVDRSDQPLVHERVVVLEAHVTFVPGVGPIHGEVGFSIEVHVDPEG